MGDAGETRAVVVVPIENEGADVAATALRLQAGTVIGMRERVAL